MSFFKRFSIRKFDGMDFKPALNIWYILDSYIRVLEITFLNYVIEIPYFWFNKPVKTVVR